MTITQSKKNRILRVGSLSRRWVISLIRVLLAFVCFALIASLLQAQQSPATASTAPVIQRDATSISILNQAVAAMGGNTVSLKSGGIIATGNIQVAPAGISGPIKWETQGSEFRYERPGPDGTIVFVSGHGNPAIVDGDSLQRNIGHLAMNLLPPHLAVLAMANAVSNANFQVAAPQQITLKSVSAIQISVVDKTDDVSSVTCKQDWYLDPTTLLPVRVDFLNSDVHNALSTVKLTYLFWNYKFVSGLAIPFTVDTLSDDQQISEVTFTSVQIGVSIPPSDFDGTTVSTGGAQ